MREGEQEVRGDQEREKWSRREVRQKWIKAEETADMPAGGWGVGG